MSINLPYMASPGTLPKILNKICEASVPESFNGDFLGTKLGFPGGNQKTFISWAKKTNFLNSDGTPTQIYKNFRNPDSRGMAMARALKNGYDDLFIRNAYAYELDRKGLTKLVSEITGNPHDNSTVKAIVSSFFHAKEFADFEKKEKEPEEILSNQVKRNENFVQNSQSTSSRKIPLGLNYTINLVLPKTDDPAIFDAIFRSLKNNLLDE